MKILIYTHAFAPMIGGVETYTMLLAQGLTERAPIEDLLADVIVVTNAPSKGMDDSTLSFRVVRKPGFSKLVRLVRNADVVHIANPAFLPMFIAWFLRKPAIVEHDGYQAVCPNGMFFYKPSQSDCPGHFPERRYKECLRCNRQSLGTWGSLRTLILTFPRRWLCNKMTLNIGPTRHVARSVKMPRTQIIYHGVPYPADVPGVSANPLPSAICFGYVGRMVQEKGVPVLLRAAQQLAKRGYEFRLKLIGDGPVRVELERMTDELELRSRTSFTGSLQGEALREAMGEVTAAVMPSIWQDVAPLASIEHMMSGRLLIASDIGGLGELVNDVGLKFPPGDVEALANCLRQVLEHPEVARQLGNKARQYARAQFTHTRMVEEHMRAYAQVVRQKPTPELSGTNQAFE